VEKSPGARRRREDEELARHVSPTWSIASPLIRMWREIAPAGRSVTLPAGVQIYSQESISPYFYLVEKGAVQATYYHQSGAVLVLEIMGPGSLFGEGSAFDRQPRQITAETLSAARLVEFHADQVASAMAADPRLAIVLIKIMSSKQRSLIPKLAMTARRSHEGALLNLLLRFVSYGDRSIQLTHAQMAEIIGASRITVTRTLARLRREGLVTLGNGIVTVLSKERLAERLERLP
jgi:CRP-like cAMP-binding protein